MRSTTAVAALLLLLAYAAAQDPCIQATVPLGDASRFAVLAGQSITTGAGVKSVINGDVGVFPGGATPMAGLALSMGDGYAIYIADVPEDSTEAKGFAQKGIDSLLVAINNAKGRTVDPLCTTPLTPNSWSGNIGGKTFYPGLYTSPAGLSITGGVDLYLDGNNDTSSVFIFQTATTFVMTAGRAIILANGAKAENIFWQVGTSATLETGSHCEGNVLAAQSVTVALGSTVTGRVLAHLASITMDQVMIALP